ncbi:lysylphosphatidylglycerol synthase domain-containing protein [Nostoc sp. FACHB-110]|uniref:lysylphosphatidylglycerol synthase transmembrane domain-containing protein n=1 Tax=Nostoc sp. FACHB-110 TaxID=2692834 RepID=UPI001689D484|nr:lysylphosphatidylglycerol synthase domain-containing protein [Nostoc sp. FACHB-110]MBD2436109.1 flippase-like domain-containing protein [Nostoc sp. FACHB-110]
MKQFLRWIILGGTLFFVAKALKDNWVGVTTLEIDAAGWAILAIATGVTLLAHTWAGWIWTWVLQDLNQPVPVVKFIQVYLKTNLAKYLPGNVWHYYGRIVAAKNANVSTGAATLSVLLEPLLMAAAAFIIFILFSGQFTAYQSNGLITIFQIAILLLVLCAVHPNFLNPVIRFLYKLKNRKSPDKNQQKVNLRLERYPLRPLLGELGFLTLRSCGFILTILAISPLSLNQIPLLLGAFSFAWLLGLVVPGAPGGLGVFEATAIALLQSRFPAAIVISAIALYRLISILAETSGAALAWLDERRVKTSS